MWLWSWVIGYDRLYMYVFCMAPTSFYGLFIWHSTVMTRSALNTLGRGCMVWPSRVLRSNGHVERLRAHRTVTQCPSLRDLGTLPLTGRAAMLKGLLAVSSPSRSRGAERYPDHPGIWLTLRDRD